MRRSSWRRSTFRRRCRSWRRRCATSCGACSSSSPRPRVACVTVLKRPRIGIDFGEDEQGRNLHVLRLVALKHWARPLGLGEGRVTYTVLESPDPAGALLDYARQAQVDHIVIGARGASAVRRYLGSVSSQVVAEASCNVTVVRTRAAESLP